jgi:hypothetical protein
MHGFSASSCSKKYGRITQFFQELDKKVFLNGRDLFKEELERFAAQLRKLTLDGRKTVPDVRLAVCRVGASSRGDSSV